MVSVKDKKKKARRPQYSSIIECIVTLIQQRKIRMKYWDIKAKEKSFHTESFTDMMPILLNSNYFGRN